MFVRRKNILENFDVMLQDFGFANSDGISEMIDIGREIMAVKFFVENLKIIQESY